MTCLSWSSPAIFHLSPQKKLLYFCYSKRNVQKTRFQTKPRLRSIKLTVVFVFSSEVSRQICSCVAAAVLPESLFPLQLTVPNWWQHSGSALEKLRTELVCAAGGACPVGVGLLRRVQPQQQQQPVCLSAGFLPCLFSTSPSERGWLYSAICWPWKKVSFSFMLVKNTV